MGARRVCGEGYKSCDNHEQVGRGAITETFIILLLSLQS